MGAPQPRRHAAGDDLDDGAGRGAGLAQPVEQIAPGSTIAASGEKKGLRSTSAQSQRPRSIAMRSDLDEGAANGGLAGHMLDHLAGDGAGGDAACGLPRRGAAAAAIVAQPVFGPIGVVGMARAELVLDLAIVLER